MFFTLCLRRETGPDGKAEVDDKNAQHGACTGKASLSLFTVANIVLIMGDTAGFGDVPGRPVLRMFRIRGVAARLIIDGDRVENNENNVDDGGKDRREDMEHVHDGLDKHDKHRENCDHEVVVGCTVVRY